MMGPGCLDLGAQVPRGWDKERPGWVTWVRATGLAPSATLADVWLGLVQRLLGPPLAQAQLCLPPGVAATRLRNRRFYPMVCSTAARSSMKVIRACASATSLQYLCCSRLRQLRPDSGDTLEGLPLPPGLKQVLRDKLGWVLSMNCSRRKPPASPPRPHSLEARPCRRKRCRRT